MARANTDPAQSAAPGNGPVRDRLAGPAQKLRQIALAIGVTGLVAIGGITARQVIIGGIALLALLGGMAIVLSAPRFRSYVDRNLPTGGTVTLIVIGGLLLVGLLESAEPRTGRSLLLLAVGLVGLLGGALADGLVAKRFRVGVAHRGLGLDESVRWFDHSSSKFQARLQAGDLAVVALMAALAAAIVAGHERSSFDTVVSALAGLIAAGGAALGAMRLATMLKAAQGAAIRRARLVDSVARLGPELVIHFSGGIRTLYQLGHWIPAINATGRSWLLVCRERDTFEAAADLIPGAALFVEHYGDLDLAIVDTVGAVFYVNTGTKNNHVIRFDGPVHIQLHHGESDKPPSGGKTMRLYDAHFVAGAAARRRLEATGVAPSRIHEVGRPVTDRLASGAAQSEGILYAPTWEGAHADSDLSSVVRFGELLVKALLATGRQVVFRPHPLTGTADPAATGAMRRIADLVRSGGGTVDEGVQPLVDSFAAAGLLVADVSSVLVDWYAVDRPALVTDVDGIGGEALRARYPTTRGAVVIPQSLAGLDTIVDEAFATDPMRQHRAEAAQETLGAVGTAQARFESALREVMPPR